MKLRRQAITHEKVLVDCDAEFVEFVGTVALLKEKLGPMVFQFPYFDRWKFPGQRGFLAVLVPFLKKLPREYRFAIEIRNRSWLGEALASVLREHRVALVLQDVNSMPRPFEMKFDPITTDWTYIRWLGDRKAIEAITTSWDKTVVDRREALSQWVTYCYQTIRRGVKVYAYANNHYAGHSPATVGMFLELWREKGLIELPAPVPSKREPSLFDRA